jgi:hypothetical protein
MIHLYKKDYDKEMSLLARIINEMDDNCILVICIQYSKERVESIKSKFSNVLEDKTFVYEEFKSKFTLLALGK